MVHMPNDEASNEVNSGSFLRHDLFPAAISPGRSKVDLAKTSDVASSGASLLDASEDCQQCLWQQDKYGFGELPVQEDQLEVPSSVVEISFAVEQNKETLKVALANQLGELYCPPAVTDLQFEDEGPYSPPSTPLLGYGEETLLGSQRLWQTHHEQETGRDSSEAEPLSPSSDKNSGCKSTGVDRHFVHYSVRSVEQALQALPELAMADQALSALALLMTDEDGSGTGSDGGSWHEGDVSNGEDSDDLASEDIDWPTFFCVNCTALRHEDVCEDCGHDARRDDGIFTRVQQQETTQVQAETRPAVLVFDERMTEHEEGKAAPHPERPDRIKAVISRLISQGLADRCVRPPCREATKEEIAACHSPMLIESVELASTSAGQDQEGQPHYFTPDTYVNSHTYECARLAAGGSVVAATAVARGEASSGTAIVRPPGHHAESGMAMGFCFFNNAGIAARAVQSCGASKVLILDWDVHHGNGTQHIFENDPSVLYMSIHRHDGGSFYPGTGAAREVGEGPGEGMTVNVAWGQSGMHDGDYLAAFHHVILPIAYEFSPNLIIVSAGFDAAEGDPIGGCNVTPAGFAHMTSLLKGVAPLVVLLEGGYNLTATAESVEAVLRVMLGESPPRFLRRTAPSRAGMMAIHETTLAQAKYWKCMRMVHLFSVLHQDSGLLVNNPTVGASVNGGSEHVVALENPAHSDDHKRKQSEDGTTVDREMERLIKRQKLAKFYQTTHRKWNLLNALHFVAMKALMKKQKLPKLDADGNHSKSSKRNELSS